MATLYVWLPLSCWLLFLGFLPAAESTWDCASKTDGLDLSYSRQYYCYNTSRGVPSTPSIEGQDSTLMDSYSSRSSSDKIQKCLKAAIGRGYKYFALFKDGECRASWENNYNDYGYERTTEQCCYYYNYPYRNERCYDTLTHCGTGYGDLLRMNVYTMDYLYDVILWIRLRRDAFAQNHEMFDKSSPVHMNVDNTILSLVKVEIDTRKICGINNGTLQWFSPESATTVIGHYLFPTSFSDISYITNQMLGLTLSAFEAEIIEVQQNYGRCSSNPYARATMYISKDFTNPSVYTKGSNYHIEGNGQSYCLHSSNYKWEVAHLSEDNSAIGNYTTVSTGTSWYLNARSLEYGLYFVQFTIRNPENTRQIGHDYGFLKIVEGPLSVYISQGSSAVYIEKQTMTLDGSDSYDPDLFTSAGVCRNNWIHLQGSCYNISSSRLNWTAAKSACEAMGSKLAIVKSQAEEQALAPKLTQSAWFGLYRDPTDLSRWLWLDGTRPTYTHWCEGEPNNLFERCGELRSPSCGWGWNDESCSATLHYICETSVGGCDMNPVGISDPSIISDSQMSASSQHFSDEEKPYHGRLNNISSNGWCALQADGSDDWLQIDLGKKLQVCGVASQGTNIFHGYTTDFKLSFSSDGNTWTTYKDGSGTEVEFHKEGDQNTVDEHKLPVPVSARFIRFHPTKQYQWNCLRVEVFTGAKVFTWVCYRNDSYPDLNNVDALNVVYPDGSNPTAPDNSEISNPPVGGCFGTGPGKMPFQDVAITFDNSRMLLGYEYYMALVVRKAHRIGIYTQRITLATVPPKFNISCFSNCLPNAIINHRIGLSASCLGPDCSRPLYYQWFLYESDELNAQEYNETKNFYNYLLTSYTSPTMLLQENFLQKKKSYRFKLQVRTEYNAEEFAYYDFRTDTQPEGGTCTMDKSTGKAVVDEFLLTCSGWIDADLPLMYQVNIPKPDNYVILAVSYVSSITLRLPVGNKYDNYNLRLEVFVQDTLLATSKVNISVTTFPPSTSDLDTNLMELIGEHGALHNYVNGEDQQRAVQLSICVLSVADNFQDTYRTVLRDNIIQSITQLEMSDTESVNQIASVLVEATKEELEITAESGLQSLGSCENMSAILSMERNNRASAEAIENAGKQIIMVTGNVLGGAVYNHTTNSTALEAIAKKALNASETLARIFHARLLPGEKPKLFESKHLSLQLARQLVGGNDSMTQDMDINGGSFVLPDLPFMSDSKHSYIDRSIRYSDLDPFIWAAQNSTYKSATPVISLSFKDDNGNSIPVQNTESLMEIIIPTGMEKNTNKTPVNFVNPGDDSMAYHFFEIKHNFTAFAVRIEPANETILAVYLRYAKRPNATHFDFKFLIPDFSSCLPPGEGNCTIISDFMQCVGREDAPYKNVNFTKPFLPRSCGPPQNDSVPPPAPSEEGEEAQTFECPDICKYEDVTFTNCSCNELPDITFLFNSTMEENNEKCKAFIDFSLCENDTLVHFKDPFRVFFNSTVGKAGKWYVGIDYYVPPNDTSTEEEVVSKKPEWLENYEKKKWWNDVKQMTDEAEVRRYLSKLIVDQVNKWYQKNCSSVKDDGCMYSYKRNVTVTCVKKLDTHLRRWRQWRHTSYSANGGVNHRRRRSFPLDFDERSSDSNEGVERIRVIVTEKHPPPGIGETLQLIKKPELDLSVSALYSFDVSLYTCLFWDETKDEWSTAGCTAGPNSTDEQLQCLCNHLTSFGGDFFVAPNTMDFDDVMLGFSNLGETGNVGVIIAVFVFVLLYIVGVIFARKTDRRDKQQLSISIPVQTKKSGDHTYEIAVYTGMFGDSGTTANVSMYINGENGESEILPLQDITGAKRPFTRGSVSTFVARLPSSVGRLNYVNVWHDNSGPSPSWNLRQIVVRHVPSDRKTFFICNRWLAVEKDDGRIEKMIFVADYKQMTGFQNLFYNRASKDIGDGHLWFSVITRPPNSSFTRVQRLTCCISLLFSSMVTNAMFYELGEAKENLRVKFGPIDFTWRQLMIGIQSSVLVVPVNLLIITIFRFTGPNKSSVGEAITASKGQDKKAATEAKTNRAKAPNEQKSKGKKETNHEKSKGKKESNDEKSKGKYKAESKSRGGKESESKSKDKKEAETKTKGRRATAKAAPKTKTSKKCKLPYWFNSIGYTLAFLTSFIGATFTMFYSMVWGKEKSDKWIISVIVSLVQDIFFLQPLKVVLVASILAILLRKPQEEEEVVENDETEEMKKEKLKDATSIDETKKNPQTTISLFTSSPDPIAVTLAKEKRLNEVKMCKLFSKFALQFFFILLLSIASYGSRSSERFYLSKNIRDIFNTKLDKVKDVYTFWWWAENYMLPSLYASEWYNGKKFEEEDFFSNKKMFIVGLPRLRQSRIKPKPCDAWHSYPEFTRWFPRCYHDFSMDNKDDGSSGATLQLVDISPAYVVGLNDSRSDGPSIQYNTLEYHDALSLGTLPIVTERNTYNGGGFLAELGYDIETAQNVLTNLQDDIWINRLTRMVLLEFVTFEPATNLFAHCRYTFVSLPTGGILPSYRIDPISFSSSNSSFSSVFIVCYVLIVLIIIYSIYREIREMRQLGCKYFKDMWNFIEWAFISFTIATIVIFFFKLEYTRRLVEKVQQNPYARMSFDYVALWTDIESVFLALVIFLATMKFLRILKFNKYISIVAKSISIAKGPLISFSVCFVVVLLGFAVFGNMAFGSSAYMFSTYPRSIVNSFEMILGKGTNYDELESINRFLGPFFFFTYFFMMTMLMMNFFMAILNDSFADAREILEAESTEDNEMADFIGEYAKERLKEIANELRGAIGGRERAYIANNNPSVNKETRERDYFLY